LAHLIPSDINRLSLAGADNPELETLAILRDRLPDDYTVFHSVHWSNAAADRTSFGEIDFVIVNKSGKVLVIEQKNGQLEETDQGLVKSYGLNRKHLGSQIQRNIGNLRTKFSRQHGDEQGLIVDYLIYCPDYRVVKVNAAGIDRTRTVDAATKDQLPQRVQELLGAGSTSDPSWPFVVKRFFEHSLAVVPDVSAYVTTQRAVFTQMLEGLAGVIGRMEFSPFRLRVIGTAGAGKSQLTLQVCEQALAKGHKPLLLCFNRPFADRLRSLVSKDVYANTYYGFCTEFSSEAGLDIDFNQMGQTGFWRRIQEHVMAAEIPESWQYDYLIVDEGQDFQQEWFEILELFLREDAGIVWLEDPLQNLRGAEPVELPGFVTYRETANYRSPASIAQFIKGSLGVDFEQRNRLPGMGVDIHTYSKPGDQIKIVSHRITELVRLGFKHEEIVVISCRGMASSAFASCDRLGKLNVRRFLGDYDADGNQLYSEGRIYFDTIFRFKGQQAPAVILVDIDETLEESDSARRILYCGMTRATVRLELVVKDGNPWQEKFSDANA
jgi:hypothetical protein